MIDNVVIVAAFFSSHSISQEMLHTSRQASTQASVGIVSLYLVLSSQPTAYADTDRLVTNIWTWLWTGNEHDDKLTNIKDGGKC